LSVLGPSYKQRWSNNRGVAAYILILV
jgi:hypothetical protein